MELRGKVSLILSTLFLSLSCISHANGNEYCIEGRCFKTDLSEYSNKYKGISGINTNRVHRSYFNINGDMLQYSYNVQTEVLNKDAYTLQMVQKTIERASQLINPYLDKRGYKKTSCQIGYESIDIYYVTRSVLGDPKRFKQIPSANASTYIPGDSLWALYDPTPFDTSSNSIYITDRGEVNEVMLAHEISHYWYDRYCIGLSNSIETEPFAKNFEEFYIRNK